MVKIIKQKDYGDYQIKLVKDKNGYSIVDDKNIPIEDETVGISNKKEAINVYNQVIEDIEYSRNASKKHKKNKKKIFDGLFKKQKSKKNRKKRPMTEIFGKSNKSKKKKSIEDVFGKKRRTKNKKSMEEIFDFDF